MDTLPFGACVWLHEQTMGGRGFLGIDVVRAKANITLTNMVYNNCRLVQIKKYHVEWIVC